MADGWGLSSGEWGRAGVCGCPELGGGDRNRQNAVKANGLWCRTGGLEGAELDSSVSGC